MLLVRSARISRVYGSFFLLQPRFLCFFAVVIAALVIVVALGTLERVLYGGASLVSEVAFVVFMGSPIGNLALKHR